MDQSSNPPGPRIAFERPALSSKATFAALTLLAQQLLLLPPEG
jgi:hypothetical protein